MKIFITAHDCSIFTQTRKGKKLLTLISYIQKPDNFQNMDAYDIGVYYCGGHSTVWKNTMQQVSLSSLLFQEQRYLEHETQKKNSIRQNYFHFLKY